MTTYTGHLLPKSGEMDKKCQGYILCVIGHINELYIFLNKLVVIYVKMSFQL